MATQTSQNTQITDIPEWMKKYMSSSDKNYSGILDEAMRSYRARSGSMTDEQLRNLKMPTRSVAGRTALQNQADAMATSGVGSYMPMLQAGAYTVGSGVQGVGRAQQMIGDAYQGATPYRDFATEQMKNAITSSQGAGARGQAAAGAGARGIMQASQAARGTRGTDVGSGSGLPSPACPPRGRVIISVRNTVRLVEDQASKLPQAHRAHAPPASGARLSLTK